MKKMPVLIVVMCATLLVSKGQHHGMGGMGGGMGSGMGTDTASDDNDSTESLVSSKGSSTGGFGAAVLKVGPLDSRSVVFLGLRGGFVINRTFVIGAGFYGTSGLLAHSMSGSMYGNTSFGYGGLELEYLIESTKLLHGSVITHFGIGSFAGDDYYYNDSYYRNRSFLSSPSFVFEPAANAELNISRWLRIALGIGYRFVTGTSYYIGDVFYNNNSVSGTFGMLQIKIGPY